MDKNYFINLTQKLYRLTFFFPAKEPLRNKLREMADQILSNLVLILDGKIEERMDSAFDVEKNIEMLDALLELSKTQMWVDRGEIEKVQDNYAVIRREIEEFNDMLRKKIALKEEKKLLTERAERIEEERRKQQNELQRQDEYMASYARRDYEVPGETLKTKQQEEMQKIREEQERLQKERELQERELQKKTEEEKNNQEKRDNYFYNENLNKERKKEEVVRAISDFAEKNIKDEYSKPRKIYEQEAVGQKKEPLHNQVRSEEHKRAVSEALKSAQFANKKSVEESADDGSEKESKNEEIKLNKRQQKIIDLLKKRDKMQVKDFQEFVPTTKRTLRRDLVALLERDMIKRTGRGNVTYYSQR